VCRGRGEPGRGASSPRSRVYSTSETGTQSTISVSASVAHTSPPIAEQSTAYHVPLEQSTTLVSLSHQATPSVSALHVAPSRSAPFAVPLAFAPLAVAPGFCFAVAAAGPFAPPPFFFALALFLEAQPAPVARTGVRRASDDDDVLEADHDVLR